ncbi:MAG: TIGR03936 family radical SAM-associated protein [Bariatricus sp.]|nr:TIGR03936 family radical SAM-associated protein [Bariatricus sp.]
MKARIKFRKNGVMKFIGHLDVMRYFQKAIRRAEIPIAFTGGYSPHMIMSFANPLGVGLTSDGEYFDIELTEPISSKEAIRRLNEQMVEGMEVTSFVEIPDDKKSKGMSIVAAAEYLSGVKKGQFPQGWQEELTKFYARDEIIVLKKTKKSEQEVNIRPIIYELYPKDDSIFMRVAAGSVQNLKPEPVLEAFLAFLNEQGKQADGIEFYHHRLETFANTGTEGAPVFVPLDELGKEII